MKFVMLLKRLRLSVVLLSLFMQPALAEQATTIDLNSASSFKLMKIDYVSRNLAKAIVRFRDESGPFKSPEDLLQVPGMNDELLQQIKPWLDENGALLVNTSNSEGNQEGMAVPNY